MHNSLKRNESLELKYGVDSLNAAAKEFPANPIAVSISSSFFGKVLWKNLFIEMVASSPALSVSPFNNSFPFAPAILE